jgi:membrane peptidoglycan carboxypeptidase
VLSPPRPDGPTWPSWGDPTPTAVEQTPSRTEPVWRPRHVGWPQQPSWDEGSSTFMFRIALGSVGGAILVPLLVVLILYASYHSLLSSSLPPERPSVISGLTRIFDDTGKQIGLLREFDLSIPVNQEDIPRNLKQAVVAVEDRRFYSHSGVDDRAVLRAIWANLTGGGYVEGASTLTQQYVRLMYLDPAKTLRRKVKEAALARKVEKEMSKDEILYRYLDRAYFGEGAYGVGAASQSYFRKPVNDLTLSEAALLAGIIRLPSINAPRSNPSGAEAVRVTVLDRMLQQRRITQAQYDEAIAQRVFLVDDAYQPDGPATVVHPPQEQAADYPYFVDYVRRYLLAKYGDDKVYRGGLKVYTSLNPSLQAKAEAAVRETLKGTAPPLEMAMVSVDPRTGLVRALVGGRDFNRSEVNLALGHCPEVPTSPPKDGEPVCVDGGGSGRQPGSAFKPITLATALEKGIPVSKVYSGPSSYRFPNCTGEGCVVSNVEGSGYGALSLRQATAYSVNTVYAQLIEDVGVEDVAEMAHRLGVTMIDPEGNLPSGEPYGPSLTLGAAEVSPLDMAAAFAVFANRGLQMAASPVVRVENPDGSVLEDVKNRKGKQVLAPDIADQMNDVLEGVVKSGTGSGADFGHPEGIAGKTGTSEDYGDAWWVGYTPQLSTAVWMGFSDSRKPLVNIKGHSRVYGATFGVPTWKAYMEAAAPELALTDFKPPGPPPTIAPRPTTRATTPGAFVAPATTPTTIAIPTPSTSVVVRPPTTRRFVPPTTTIFRVPTTAPRQSPPTTRFTLPSFPP